MIRWRILAALATALVATPVLHSWRGLDWSFALVVGIALGAFAFLLVRAVHNLAAWRPRR